MSYNPQFESCLSNMSFDLTDRKERELRDRKGRDSKRKKSKKRKVLT